MKTTEMIDLMSRCRDEIRHLRNIIDRLSPKAEAWDRMGVVLNMIPQRTGGMSEDLAWFLDQHINALQNKPQPVTEAGEDK